ncbi:PHP domain-containing protein [Clostridium oryzae]|uniref:Putative hydrolase n=1 Tax=Clostridium oryzae TaxID=1450648 RepID=A0A1V4IS16_9CLOT|nr:PHP domain-containing protein [Clostridium oryzae]OPJ62610.1 putative hydrolase [Clostridium oryzae]
MKIDMHVHCSERSNCSISTEQEHIESAIEHGLDAIVITDHNKLVPEEHLKELNKKYYPFRIFGGIEVTTEPHGDDVLVIGVIDSILEEQKWSYEKLYKYVKARGGFIALCHPYRYENTVNIDIATFVPDAIEIHSTNIGRCDGNLIKTLAARLGSKLIGNSDAHSYLHTGLFYNVLSSSPKSEQELANTLLNEEIIIGEDEQRINSFNEKVRKREKLIKQLIAEGKNAEDFNRITGEWVGCFNRVVLGKSYEI